MPHFRREARILAMQALCEWEVQRQESSQTLADLSDMLEAAPKAVAYATELVLYVWRTHELIDRNIAAAMSKWDLSRLTPVERCVMRVAVAELQIGEVPVKVVLNEGIEIARAFGGAESPRFVNGVLDAIVQRMQEETT